MTKQADFKRRVRARMDKTGESYTAARAQLLAGAGALHVTNGDSTAARCAGRGWCAGSWSGATRCTRARCPTSTTRGCACCAPSSSAPRWRGRGAGAARARAARPRARGRPRRPYVLWFEADLYDQLQLAQILARLAASGAAPERVTLICVGEHRGFAHFGGLGELGPSSSSGCPQAPAVTLTADAFDLAMRAWAALRAPDPRGLAAIVAARSPQLRFLPEAFDRLGREYPSTRDGLSLTERRLLAAVAEGAATPVEAFLRASAREARPFLGDTWAFAALDRLAAGDVPLLDGQRLTDAGGRVLRGEADHVALNGVDRWVGGVHLRGRSVAWRWDDGTEAVVAA